MPLTLSTSEEFPHELLSTAEGPLAKVEGSTNLQTAGTAVLS